MASREKDESQGFLSRWSQRKREAEEPAAPEAELPQEAAVEGAAVDPRDLPDIESLDAGSDFTVFMKSGVPSALKQQALRRLWQVDPSFNVICMLDDYNLDYTDAAMVVPNLKTIYQVGRGMVLPEAAPEPVPEPQPAVASSDAAAPSPEALEEPAQPSPVPSPDPDAPAEQPIERTESEPANRQTATDEAVARPVAGSARRRRWGDFET